MDSPNHGDDNPTAEGLFDNDISDPRDNDAGDSGEVDGDELASDEVAGDETDGVGTDGGDRPEPIEIPDTLPSPKTLPPVPAFVEPYPTQDRLEDSPGLFPPSPSPKTSPSTCGAVDVSTMDTLPWEYQSPGASSNGTPAGMDLQAIHDRIAILQNLGLHLNMFYLFMEYPNPTHHHMFYLVYIYCL